MCGEGGVVGLGAEMSNVTQEYLLVCLMEECAEVAKVASKIYRFGQNDTGPHEELPNKTIFSQELGDLMGVLDFLRSKGIQIDENVLEESRSRKQARIIRFFDRKRKP